MLFTFYAKNSNPWISMVTCNTYSWKYNVKQCSVSEFLFTHPLFCLQGSHSGHSGDGKEPLYARVHKNGRQGNLVLDSGNPQGPPGGADSWV